MKRERESQWQKDKPQQSSTVVCVAHLPLLSWTMVPVKVKESRVLVKMRLNSDVRRKFWNVSEIENRKDHTKIKKH